MVRSLVIAAALWMGVPTVAHARSFRVDQLPNGTNKCEYCHVTADGGPRNAFGLAVTDMGLLDEGNLINERSVVWLSVCENDLDSDGDGYPNGVELGDPTCTWTIGDANPNFTASNPGRAAETPCGNGSLEMPYEECDGLSFGGMTCGSLGLGTGALKCTAECKRDTSGCTTEPANNGTNNATNNGTNNATNNGTNNSNNTNNAPNNQTGNNNTSTPTTGPDTPTDPDDAKDEVEPFFCDGEMDADEDYKEGATGILGIILLSLFRRRLFR